MASKAMKRMIARLLAVSCHRDVRMMQATSVASSNAAALQVKRAFLGELL
jgi:hypothetical protein